MALKLKTLPRACEHVRKQDVYYCVCVCVLIK